MHICIPYSQTYLYTYHTCYYIRSYIQSTCSIPTYMFHRFRQKNEFWHVHIVSLVWFGSANKKKGGALVAFACSAVVFDEALKPKYQYLSTCVVSLPRVYCVHTSMHIYTHAAIHACVLTTRHAAHAIGFVDTLRERETCAAVSCRMVREARRRTPARDGCSAR